MERMDIYLDHNATTPLRPEVWEAMARVELGPESHRNPSSLHRPGMAGNRALSAAREQLAAAINADPQEIVFTGGGSESINTAVKGIAWASDVDQPHLVSSAAEHHAVLHALEWLGSNGARVTLVPVDRRCRIDPGSIAEALTPDTILVSVMLVNNEIGLIQPVTEIGEICREAGVPLHLDAVQALGKLPVDVEALQCDLLSCSAHKLGGPKGVGLLYVRKGTPLVSLIHGGGQEAGLRAGTQNVAGIVGFAEAARLAEAEREGHWEKWLGLRELLFGLPQELDAVRVNSDPDLTVPNCINMTFMHCDGMTLTANLNARGIYVSTGSACTAGSVEPSHVLKAMGLTDRAGLCALRFSMGFATTAEEVRAAVETTRELVGRLRLVTAPDDIGKCEDDCPCFLMASPNSP